MAIKRRLSPEDRFESRMGPHWKLLLKVPMIVAMCRGVNALDASAENLTRIIETFNNVRWITAVPLDHKIFMYACGLVAKRADVSGFLTEEQHTQLGRHLAAQSTISKIDEMDGVSFAFRQCFVWDIPVFRERYKAPGSFALPTPPAPSAPRRKRLAKHSKRILKRGGKPTKA